MKKKAVTLIELIIGITILLVLAGSVLLSFNTLDSRRLDSESRGLLSVINLAREYSVSRHEDYIIGFNITAESYSLYHGSIASNNLVSQHNLSIDLVSVEDYSGTAQTQLTFSPPRGTAQSRIITLSRSGKSRVVNVTDETGYARIE